MNQLMKEEYLINCFQILSCAVVGSAALFINTLHVLLYS